jgi:hypothetical protein
MSGGTIHGRQGGGLLRAGYVRVPPTLKDELRDTDGTKMVYLLWTPIWGETEAGFEWDSELDRVLRAIGCLPAGR